MTDPVIPTIEEATAAAVEGVAYFTVVLAMGWPRGNVVHELRTLAYARAAAKLLPAFYQTHRRAIVYAVTPEGRSFMVPDDMPDPQKKAMTIVHYRGFTIEAERDGTWAVFHSVMHYVSGGHARVRDAEKAIDEIAELGVHIPQRDGSTY
jgi:hypothetical protein